MDTIQGPVVQSVISFKTSEFISGQNINCSSKYYI